MGWRVVLPWQGDYVDQLVSETVRPGETMFLAMECSFVRASERTAFGKEEVPVVLQYKVRLKK